MLHGCTFLSAPNAIGEHSNSTKPWKDVPRGTMDEVSSHVCLVLPSTDGKAARKIVPPRLRIPYWKGLGADSEEKHEPVSDIDTVVVDSLKALDPKRPIREVEPLLIVRRALREQIVILHRRLLAIVRDDEVCRRLMTTPGVGPVVALTYRATVDVPARFRKSKSVGAVFGLTCAKYQSGEVDRNGRIARCGDEMMRVMLYEAAQSMLRSKKWSWLKAWAMQIARRRGMKKAIVALARRVAVIMHRIWVDGSEFRRTREQAAE